MKIGIVTTWFERGAAYVSKQYMDSFVNSGHEVKIYARGGEHFAKGDPVWDGQHVYWQKSNCFPIFNYVELKEFKEWVLKNKFDFVIFNEQVWFEPVIFCKKEKIKVGAYIDYYTESMIPCFDIYDFLICNTKKHYQAFKEHRCPIYVPWGTDTTLFDVENLRSSSESIRFFHSCGMNPHRKGTDLLLKAYLSMTDDEILNTQLIIHSQISVKQLLSCLDKSEKERFHQLVDTNISIIEKTVTAPGLYHLGDVYVYPSRLDGLGLTVCEAISCGMPVIVPDDGPMNEFAITGFDKKVKIERLFSRSDGYYWPQNTVDLSDLKSSLYQMKIDFFEARNRGVDLSKAVRLIALDKFNWMENSKSLGEDIYRVKNGSVDDEIVRDCIRFNERKFPKIYSLKWLYKSVFYFYKLIIK
ncbi:TPA: glycosyltransferase family 4 protein [Vibrio cholerae]|uniref:glycosyltransferase family 4 protein n=1 Tax=Vibrio cholerae TaxID=666 RepID=UPI0011DA7ED9|nr:glycosyltransferase family 4 protein [Vibrio cholerae]EGR4342627.1 glycosyltransferase [Vibrio cholerae]EII2378228.1 glycosyltransferase family 4 protein [Vibrio cholerae]EJL6915743.1 glycosyltransferase family 4 protein [Vibrio cholerae]TXX63470.1 glycosyltransferase family 4 protein [Vibrio cholerae]BCN17713.1 putative glycosyltransferase [Vibrio cholerae]